MASGENQAQAASPPAEIEFTLDGSELIAFLDDLLVDLAESPEFVRNRAIELVKTPSELIRFEQGVAAGATVLLLLKPSQRLLDFGVAVRTGNFDLLVVE